MVNTLATAGYFQMWSNVEFDGDSGQGFVGLTKNCPSLKLGKSRCFKPLLRPPAKRG